MAAPVFGKALLAYCHFLSSRPFSALFQSRELRSRRSKMEDNLVLLLQRVIDENSRLRETIEARDNEQKRILEELSAKFESNSTSTPERNTVRKRKRSIAVSPQCRVSVVTLLSTIVIDQAKLSSVVCIVEVLRLHNVFNVLSLLITYTRGCLRVLAYSEVPIWLQLFKRWIALSTGEITIHWITQLVLLVFIRWIVIYPVDSAIHRLNNWGLGEQRRSDHASACILALLTEEWSWWGSW